MGFRELMRRADCADMLSGMLELLEHLNCAAIMLSVQGTIAGMNSRALNILSRSDGIAEKEGYPCLPDSNSQKQLDVRIRVIINSIADSSLDSQRAIKVRRSHSPSACIPGITPLQNSYGALRKIAGLIHIVDPDAVIPDIKQQLMQWYGLTKTESLLVQALCNGSSLREFPESRQSSIETARYHLKNVFSKLGVKKQSELIRFVLSVGLPK